MQRLPSRRSAAGIDRCRVPVQLRAVSDVDVDGDCGDLDCGDLDDDEPEVGLEPTT